MKIKTKYSIGDKVYFIKDNIIRSFNIQAISVTTQSYYDGIAVAKIRESYSDDFYGNKNYVCEKLLFKNIEGIVEDLKNKVIENK